MIRFRLNHFSPMMRCLGEKYNRNFSLFRNPRDDGALLNLNQSLFRTPRVENDSSNNLGENTSQPNLDGKDLTIVSHIERTGFALSHNDDLSTVTRPKNIKKAANRPQSGEPQQRVIDDVKEKGRSMDKRTFDAAIEKYGKLKRSQAAWATFESMTSHGVHPDPISYHHIIYALINDGRWKKALQLLKQMKQTKIIPLVRTYKFIAHACKCDNELDLMIQILKEMDENGIPPDVVVYTMAISLFGKKGMWIRALELLNKLEESAVAPDVQAFTATITACAHSGHWQHALILLRSMEKLGPTPSGVTYAAAMRACLGTEKREKKARLARGLIPDEPVYTSAILACERGQRWSEAVDVLGRMQARGLTPGHRAFALALSACSRGKRWQEALDLMDSMTRVGVAPTADHYRAAITACVRAGEEEAAATLRKELSSRKELSNRKEGAKDSVANGSSGGGESMSGSADATNILLTQEEGEQVPTQDDGEQIPARAALSIFHKLKGKGFAADIRIYAMAVTAHGDMGEWEAAMRLFSIARAMGEEDAFTAKLAKTLGEPADLTLCKAVLHALAQSNRVDEALAVLDDMEANGPEADVWCYTSAISACKFWWGSSRYKDAMELLARMEVRGVVPNVVTFNCALGACFGPQQTDVVLEEMRRWAVEPNVITHSVLMMSKWDDWEGALQCLEAAKKAGIIPDIILYTSAMVACSRAKQWAPALEILDYLEEQGVKMDTLAMTVAGGEGGGEDEARDAVVALLVKRGQGRADCHALGPEAQAVLAADESK